MAITSARLTLTPLRVRDAHEMVAVLADGALYAFTGGQPPSLEELRERYRRQVGGRSVDGSERWLNWIVRVREGGTAVGFVQATVSGERGEQADVAWLIGGEWQGRGYAAEAVQAMIDWLGNHGVELITAHIHPAHHASAAVARRCGLAPTDEFSGGEIVWRGRPPAPRIAG